MRYVFSWKKIVLIVLAIFIVLLIRFIFGGDEGTWICEDGVWQKHGNPNRPMPEKTCSPNVVH